MEALIIHLTACAYGAELSICESAVKGEGHTFMPLT